MFCLDILLAVIFSLNSNPCMTDTECDNFQAQVNQVCQAIQLYKDED